MNTSDLIQAIKEGRYDEDIHLLRGEILNRFVALEARKDGIFTLPYVQPARVMQNINDFRIGKKVRIGSNAGTAYLRGQTAVVIKVKRTRVTIKLDLGEQGRFVGGTVTCPTSILSIIG